MEYTAIRITKDIRDRVKIVASINTMTIKELIEYWLIQEEAKLGLKGK